MPPKRDYTGEKYGRLTAIKQDPDKPTGYWIWKCECGNTKTIKADSVVSGKTKSCGCLNLEKIHEKKRNFVDYSGKRFGELEVIEYVSSDKRGTHWKCLCHACGQYCIKCASDLKHAKTCGCGEQKNRQKIVSNFREKNYVENTNVKLCQKKKPNANNKLGVKGVWFDKNTQKYIAYISFQKKNRVIGRYKTLEEAKFAREKAVEERDILLEEIVSDIDKVD